MTKHVLDRPVWNALSTCQTLVAVGGALARRFSPNIGPLAAACDDSPQSLDALAELIPLSGHLILLQAEQIVLPPRVDVIMMAPGVQMVANHLEPMIDRVIGQIEILSNQDVPAMLELATLTRPGPFELGTASLGGFLGIKENNVLVAMAGERMKHLGYTEISGVCVHPSARGRNYARVLSTAVAARIIDRGETPYLHAYATNTAAIKLYESIGFRVRCPVYVATIALQGLGSL
ncbi:MAG TPA: GNAT family N-acetyltransferase [Oligoflexus sp.]|uniref:GNAT family N-acetyltransferase n=1 Tax=Oligoflexus sp. TaxID=1971216 RepID=UPI002D53D3F5|nr:GNAT family N-acetyltransferase [Oligoflexus sp.]HYX33704.1 GNAT family N-acetyltransferase [Oligoflexus sp.]